MYTSDCNLDEGFIGKVILRVMSLSERCSLIVPFFWRYMLCHGGTYCLHIEGSRNPGEINTLRMRSFKLFKRPFPGFLTILTLSTLN